MHTQGAHIAQGAQGARGARRAHGAHSVYGVRDLCFVLIMRAVHTMCDLCFVPIMRAVHAMRAVRPGRGASPARPVLGMCCARRAPRAWCITCASCASYVPCAPCALCAPCSLSASSWLVPRPIVVDSMPHSEVSAPLAVASSRHWHGLEAATSVSLVCSHATVFCSLKSVEARP